MQRFLCVAAVAILLSSPALAGKSGKQPKSDDTTELLRILKETKSRDAFLFTLRLLVEMDPQCDGLLPIVVRRADELGLLKGIASGKNSDEQEWLGESVKKILGARDTSNAPVGALIGVGLAANEAAPKLSKPEFPLTPRGKKKNEDVKVVVLTSCSAGIAPDMIGVDRLLASQVIPLLEERCKANKEKVVVLKSTPLDAYKRDNPDWRTKNPREIGEHFKADYVIDIEVVTASMYEPGTCIELMRGRATIAMKAYDMSKQQQEPDFDPIDYNFEFPRTNPVPVVEEPKSTFRQKFIRKIAQGLVLPYTPHTVNQRTMVD